MSNFRKFAQFCAGIAAFSAIMYVFRQFRSYDPEDIESKKEKLKLFFSNEMSKDYRPLTLLAILFVLAILIEIILKRFPQICIFSSSIPLLFALSLYNGDRLFERPMLYVLLGGILVIGDIYDTVSACKADGKERMLVLSNVSALLVCAACLFIRWRAHECGLVPIEKLSFFDKQLYLFAMDHDASLFTIIAIMTAITIAVSLILRGVYFIDLAITLVPFFYIVYKLATNELGPHGDIVAAAMTVCLAARIVCCVMGGRAGKPASILV